MRFDLNPGALVELLSEREAVAYWEDATQALADEARAGSPQRTGKFSRSFTTDVSVGATGPVGTLGNTDPGAVPIEFGSVNNPPFAPMRRAARSLGLRMESD